MKKLSKEDMLVIFQLPEGEIQKYKKLIAKCEEGEAVLIDHEIMPLHIDYRSYLYQQAYPKKVSIRKYKYYFLVKVIGLRTECLK